MRNRIFLIGCLTLGLLAGCANDDAVSDDNNITLPLIPDNSDVKIQISSGSGTRAAMNPDENGAFETTDLGIFCLANRFVTNTQLEQSITWTPASSFAKYYRLLDNIEAKAVKSNDGSSTYTDIRFVEDGKEVTKYYPLSNWLTYQFYGYYPRTGAAITNGSTKVLAEIPITGKEDVIHGFTANETPNAYSAKYFRETDHIGETPEIPFDHKLIQVQFKCVAGKIGENVDEKAKNLVIKKLEIVDAPKSVTLVVASVDPDMPTGTMSITKNANTTYTISDPDDAEFTPVQVSDDVQNVGQGIMLPPLSVDGTNGLRTEYKVRITLAQKNEDGTETLLETYPDAVMKAENGFTKPGTLYNTIITIYSPTEVTLRASLKPWVEDNDEHGIEY